MQGATRQTSALSRAFWAAGRDPSSAIVEAGVRAAFFGYAARVTVAEQIAHYRAHPPRALAGLRATPIDVAWTFDGHGKRIDCVFELACGACGATKFVAMCNATDEGEVCSPITLHCDGCKAAFEIFDSGKHGFDGESGDFTGDEGDGPYDLETTEVDEPHEVVVRYEYPPDRLGEPRYAGREHDLFSWFTLLARDPTTKQLEHMYDFECA